MDVVSLSSDYITLKINFDEEMASLNKFVSFGFIIDRLSMKCDVCDIIEINHLSDKHFFNVFLLPRSALFE